ncbi:hypothetical protein C4J81_05690 [Deltaproteobacteria bacterium Smac51]|nr:hypothetical protein C4J81_05690 [Deltaproteobacteria bacterium Smac51]
MAENTSTVSKMVIEIYDDDAFTKKSGSYAVLFNPETYSLSWQYELSQMEVVGGGTTRASLAGISDTDFDMTFLIDGTGVGAAALGRDCLDVTDEIWKFMTIATILNRDGSRKPQPPFCRLVWGSLCQRAIVKRVKIDVKMSDRNGKALRASLTVSFGSVFPPKAA